MSNLKYVITLKNGSKLMLNKADVKSMKVNGSELNLFEQKRKRGRDAYRGSPDVACCQSCFKVIGVEDVDKSTGCCMGGCEA